MIALVTGHMGFLGSHFAATLRALGYEVRGCDTADRPYTDAREMFEKSTMRYDLVVHCAAVVGGRARIEDGGVAQAINLELDAAMFRWAVRRHQNRVLYISSSAVYPAELQQEPGWPLREFDVNLNYPRKPDELYGWTKLTGEMLAARARNEGVPVTVIRPFSGYGEDQDLSYPFAAFADRARRRCDPFEIWGTGRQVRDFVHVDDIVDAALAAVDERTDLPVNIGTGRGTSMLALAKMMCDAAGYEPTVKLCPAEPKGVAYRVADTARMAQLYTPKVSLEEGVQRAIHREV